ncbi:MAG TPA: glycosyltransferase [Bryobacteraceae bacterium]|jgi:glycosyltransferase involved in cell wall biosynthesis
MTEVQSRTAIVILTWNDLNLLRNTLETFRAFNGNRHLYIVDNGSDDGTAEYLTEFPHCTLIRHAHNLGIVRGTFSGWRHAVARGHEFILHVESDFPSIRPVPFALLEEYLDQNVDVGFVRLNDRRDARRNIATKKPISYQPWKDIGEGFRIAKYNYHMAFHPYLFRGSFVEHLSKTHLRTERGIMNRYEKLKLNGAKLAPSCFTTLPQRHWQLGWRW